MRQTLTTVIGVVFIVFGLIGLSMSSANLLFILRDDPAIRKANLGLIDKVAVIGVGVLLLKRSRLVRFLLPCLLVLSAVDSVAMYLWFMPPIPQGLDSAGVAGRIAGRASGLTLPLVFYALTIGYLMLARTRREFGENYSAAAV